MIISNNPITGINTRNFDQNKIHIGLTTGRLKKNYKKGKLDKLNDIIFEDLITGCNRRNLNVVVQYDISRKKPGSITINQLPYHSKD